MSNRLFNLSKSTGKHFNRVFFSQFIHLNFNDAVNYGHTTSDQDDVAPALMDENCRIDAPGANQRVVVVDGKMYQVSKYWGVQGMRELLAK